MEAKTMKASVLEKFGEPLKIKTLPIPTPAADEVLVKVMASGLCLTDVHIQNGILKTVKLPYTPGHEMAGIIAGLGSSVTDVKLGEHVVVGIDVICNECALCRAGRPNLCLNRVRIGFERDGSHAEYAVVPAANVVPIDKSIPFAQAAILPDAVACIYNAIIRQGKVKKDDRVLFTGMGALGMQGVQIARNAGAVIYASGRTDEKLGIAVELGAAATVNTRHKNLVDEIRRLTSGDMCDVVFDLIGSESSLNEALLCVRPGGKVVAAAYAADEFRANYQEVVLKEKEIIGVRGSTLQDLRDTVRLTEQGKIVPYVSATYRLDDINEALNSLREFKSLGRSVIEFN